MMSQRLVYCIVVFVSLLRVLTERAFFLTFHHLLQTMKNLRSSPTRVKFRIPNNNFEDYLTGKLPYQQASTETKIEIHKAEIAKGKRVEYNFQESQRLSELLSLSQMKYNNYPPPTKDLLTEKLQTTNEI